MDLEPFLTNFGVVGACQTLVCFDIFFPKCVFPVEVVVSGFRQNANLCIHRPSSKEAANWMQDTDPRTLFDPLHFMFWVLLLWWMRRAFQVPREE